MNLLTNRIIFKKTGLLLLVILFFLGCKKEKNKIGLDDSSRLPSNAYFTDTITIKSNIVLINDSINTTNVVGSAIGNSPAASFMMVGTYADALFGKTTVEAYTKLRLTNEYVELPAATADSAFLYLSYSYHYGNNLSQPLTLKVYPLTDFMSRDMTYFSNSPALTHGPEIGSITFNASSDSAAQMRIPLNGTFLQDILNASKNNVGFEAEIPGLVIIPTSTDGAIIRIDGNSDNTALHIHYTQYGQSNIYPLTLNSTAKKFYRVTVDRTGTDLASLVNNYDSISTDALPFNTNRCYIQACAGIRTRISFPYLKNLRKEFPNIAVIRGELLIAPSPSTDNYAPNTTLLMMRTDGVKVKRNAAGGIYYVQPDDYSQFANTSVNLVTLIDNQYSFPMKSYVQAVLVEQIPNNPIIISPGLLYTDINRLVFNDHSHTDQPIKLKLYFTTTK